MNIHLLNTEHCVLCTTYVQIAIFLSCRNGFGGKFRNQNKQTPNWTHEYLMKIARNMQLSSLVYVIGAYQTCVATTRYSGTRYIYCVHVFNVVVYLYIST